MRTLAVFCFVCFTTFWPAQAADCGDACDRTLSPYFFIRDGDPEVDRMPLESTSAEVRIAAVFAQVTVRQVYKNAGNRTLEAVYVFPASTRAAVHGMKMKIGDRTIAAEVREREQARRDYEKARGEGRSAALLEQNRPNVFQMNVANILPGDRIEVELVYSELLEPVGGVYEFVYPTVVGPRYSTTERATATDGERWVENPYLQQGQAPPHRFDLSVEMAAGMPIQDFQCPSHQVKTQFHGPAEASLRLDPSEKEGSNRDFILRFRLTGNRISSGLLMEEGAEEDFFLLMLQPPQRAQLEAVPPREYIFVVDVSGSMHGFPLETSRELMRKLIEDLRPSDFFNILFFSGGSFVLSETSLPATASNVQKALESIGSRQAGGGTNLLPALQRAMDLPRADPALSRSVLIATDGFVNVERRVFQLIRERLGDANLFTFGIGSSVNRYLIEGMARAGWGQSFVVTDSAQAASEAERFRKYVSAPVLTDVQPVFAGFEAYDLEPPHVPDLFGERPLVILGKCPPSSAGRGGSAKVTVEGLAARGVWSRSLRLKDAYRTPPGLLSRLWARQRVALLADYGDLEDEATKRQVTELGLRHGLLTAFTSFVAVDTVVRAGEEATKVVQPLPLPAGVSNSAVGSVVTLAGTNSLSMSFRSGAAGGVVGGVPGGIAESLPKASPVRTVAELSASTGHVMIPEKEATARLTHRVPPEYPELARRAKVSGEVVLRVTIDENGKVEDVKLIRGHPLLNKAAVEAVKKWKYDPVLLGGHPVKAITTVKVTFRLD